MNGILGPRSLLDILVETFKIYKTNPIRLLAIVAIVEIGLGFMWSIPDFSGLRPSTPDGGTASLTHLIPVGIMLAVASIMGLSLMQGALIHAISEQYLRQSINIGRAFRFAWERLAALAGAMILALFATTGILAVSIGYTVSISPDVGYVFIAAGFCVGLYLMVRWSFILQVALLERLGPLAAMSRSSALVKRNWWRVMNMTIIIGIITVGISIILGTIPTIGPTLGSILSTPVFAIGITLLYYDLRVRKEEYNLDLLAAELHVSEFLGDTESNRFKMH
ncbi:MAG: hypothetical protein JSW12_03090 [Deltaproteobacteria bacterium]|nr:MAG: hypothetical protein JSW12_03090 [Deltaproteobacteria bacterium]